MMSPTRPWRSLVENSSTQPQWHIQFGHDEGESESLRFNHDDADLESLLLEHGGVFDSNIGRAYLVNEEAGVGKEPAVLLYLA